MDTEYQSIEQQKAKLTYLVKVAAIVITVSAIAWTIFFAVNESWLGVIDESIYIFIGGLTYRLNDKNNTKKIAYVCLPLFFMMLCLSCLFFDVPIAVTPRSTHNILLPLALYAYILYQNERPALRVIVPGLVLSAFIVFACTNYGFYTPIMSNE